MLSQRPLVIVPPPPPRFSQSEWVLNNKLRYRAAEDQQQLADRTAAESARVRDATANITAANKAEVDAKLRQRIADIEFRKAELELQKAECCKEEAVLNTYKERILNTMEALSQQALNVVKKCIILREGRLGIDLVHDQAEHELHREVRAIEGAQTLLQRMLEQTNEQLRLLRSTKYFIDRDTIDKGIALAIDGACVNLKETSLNLSLYKGKQRLDAGNITGEDWENYSSGNIERAAKEVNNCRPLRSYVDTLLKQVIEDLWEQYYITNEAFQQQIKETREAKNRLENQHRETLRKANEMVRNITELEKSIVDKQHYLALAHTRLGNRAQRPNIELCKDEVELRLVSEVRDLESNIGWLRQMLAEAQASLRYLLKTQIQLEEDINIKTNTLKIDEVDCMTLRGTIVYRTY